MAKQVCTFESFIHLLPQKVIQPFNMNFSCSAFYWWRFLESNDLKLSAEAIVATKGTSYWRWLSRSFPHHCIIQRPFHHIATLHPAAPSQFRPRSKKSGKTCAIFVNRDTINFRLSSSPTTPSFIQVRFLSIRSLWPMDPRYSRAFFRRQVGMKIAPTPWGAETLAALLGKFQLYRC